MKIALKIRMIYLIAFFLLVAIEVLIALFVHDRFVRPYIGDVIIIFVIYCFVRMIIPDGIKLLPLYIFIFALAIEIGQYFNYVTLLGLDNNSFFRIFLGTSFSFADIICYAVGGVICFAEEYFHKRKALCE
jgi:hypothetical protein